METTDFSTLNDGASIKQKFMLQAVARAMNAMGCVLQLQVHMQTPNQFVVVMVNKTGPAPDAFAMTSKKAFTGRQAVAMLIQFAQEIENSTPAESPRPTESGDLTIEPS